MLHQVGAFHELGTVQLAPTGYANSPAMGVPQGPPRHNGWVVQLWLLLLCPGLVRVQLSADLVWVVVLKMRMVGQHPFGMLCLHIIHVGSN